MSRSVRSILKAVFISLATTSAGANLYQGCGAVGGYYDQTAYDNYWDNSYADWIDYIRQ